jgi:hypothetical protein
MSLAWKLNRLAAMSAGEIQYRIGQKLQAGIEQMGLLQARPGPPREQAGGHRWIGELPVQLDITTYTRAADRVLAGHFDVFALEGASLGFPPEWNRDPKTGTLAPLAFGKSIDYRQEALVGDIKYLWEPSRHLQLVTLAQAWHLTGSPVYAQGCRTLLDSWFEQCPYLQGVHWTSSLEHGVRLLNWSFAWHLLGGDAAPIFEGAEGRAFRRRWLESIYQHCHFIAGHFSRYSSANNHLLGELAGLFVAATTWPLWPESRRWQQRAYNELAREALLQNTPDGVNREQAVWYQHEVADLLLLSGLVARANGRDFSPAYWRQLEALLEFVASIMDCGSNVPNLGDADDGYLVRFDPRPQFDVYRSLLATGAVLFARPELAAKAGSFDDKSRWLLGDAAADTFAALARKPVRLPVRLCFPEGGHYILGGDFETPREVRIVADAAPLGYLSIAAHGHADALAFTLSAAGKELLIDPGTYAYHTQKCWRDYFRGTSAHNTVRVDGQDQSLAAGNFLWRRHAETRIQASSSNGTRLIACHTGYERLPDPVIHRREWHYERVLRRLTIADHFECRGAHELEIFWHFAPEVTVETSGEELIATRDDVRITLASAGCSYEVQCGSTEPPLGWISRRFDLRSPSPTAVSKLSITGSTTVITTIDVELAADSGHSNTVTSRSMSIS